MSQANSIRMNSGIGFPLAIRRIVEPYRFERITNFSILMTIWGQR